MAQATDKDEALKRLGGGRWQTRDERFTIEPQSGTWVVVDGEQTDDLGLPLVRGPFGSLRDAKAAIETARDSEPAESPLNARVAELRGRPKANADKAADRTSKAEPKPEVKATGRSGSAAKGATSRAEEPIEPSWLTELEPDQRRRARR